MSTSIPPEFKPFSAGDSVFRLIEVAIERNRQLMHGSLSRLGPDFNHRKNISIALEEVRQGLVPFADKQSRIRSESQMTAHTSADAGASHPHVETRQVPISRQEPSQLSTGKV